MKIGFASDHAGYDLKERLKAWAQAQGHEAVDFGTDGHASVDYPDFAHRAAEGMDKWERLVLVCGSGHRDQHRGQPPQGPPLRSGDFPRARQTGQDAQ